ncbi:MAG: DUF1398 family protein [Myxococcales bacterium]
MDAQRIAIAEECLAASYAATKDFPSIVRSLIGAGFEGYTVDFRRGTVTYYLPSGDSVELASPRGSSHAESKVAAEFKAGVVEGAVREAQTNAPGYTYQGFCEKVKAAGCAGYLVSFLGKRVVYFGRSAETHVEHFPQ